MRSGIPSLIAATPRRALPYVSGKPAFLITRNIGSSYIAHLANDGSLFALMLVLPKLAAAALR